MRALTRDRGWNDTEWLLTGCAFLCPQGWPWLTLLLPVTWISSLWKCSPWLPRARPCRSTSQSLPSSSQEMHPHRITSVSLVLELNGSSYHFLEGNVPQGRAFDDMPAVSFETACYTHDRIAIQIIELLKKTQPTKQKPPPKQTPIA